MFFKKKPKQIDNKLIFILKDNKISISLEINPNTENIASSIGELLYNINCGDLEDPIASMLVNFGESGQINKQLTDQIIYHWSRLKQNDDKLLDQAYISPLKVFEHD